MPSPFYEPAVRLSVNDTATSSWNGVIVQVDEWSTAPTFASSYGDRSTFTPSTGAAYHLASFTCTMTQIGDGSFAECPPVVGTSPAIKLGSGTSVYWTLHTITASATTSGGDVWTLTAELSN